MQYEKPEILMLASATNAIEGGLKGTVGMLDLSKQEPTIGAYEADE